MIRKQNTTKEFKPIGDASLNKGYKIWLISPSDKLKKKFSFIYHSDYRDRKICYRLNEKYQ